MMGSTHMLAGAAAWLATDAALRMPPAALAVGTAAASVAALVPDIDAKKSEITQAGWIITGALSWVLRKYCGGHRQVTHSLLGAGIWAVIWTVVTPLAGWPLWLLFALIQGYASHIAMDMLTRSGCPLLWPDRAPWHWLPKQFRVTTGGKSRLSKTRRRGRRRWLRSGAEYCLIQPACLTVAIVSATLVIQGH